jgi:hypothetical protein
VRHRRRGFSAQHRPHPRPGPAAAGIPRLRLLRRGGAPGRPAACPQHLPGGRADGAGRAGRSRAAPALPTPAGPPTARRRCTTPTRISATGPGADSASGRAAWRWCTTASSKTTTSCAPSCRPRATCSPARPTPRSSPTWCTACTTATCSTPCKARRARLQGRLRHCRVLPDEPHRVVGAREGSPLVLGVGKGAKAGENFLASDAMALAGVTDQIVYLEEGDVVDLQLGKHWITDKAARPMAASAGAARRAHRAGPQRRGRAGPLPPLHAEGDLRAAARHRRHAGRRGGHHAELFGDGAYRIFKESTGADPGLRHQLLQRLHRQVLAGEHRRHPHAGGDRQRVPLPRQRARPAHAGRHHHARAARRPTPWPRCAMRAGLGMPTR